MAEYVDLNLIRSGDNDTQVWAFRPHPLYGSLFYVGEAGSFTVSGLTSGDYDWVVHAINTSTGAIDSTLTGSITSSTTVTIDYDDMTNVSILSIEVMTSGGTSGNGLTAGDDAVAFLRINDSDPNDPLLTGKTSFTDSLLASWTVTYSRNYESTFPIEIEIFEGNASGDQFGYATSISDNGNIIVVGAPFETFSSVASSGKAYIYRNTTSGWALDLTIDPKTTAEQCGSCVAVSGDGNTVAVSSPYNNETGTQRGLVRIYQWDGFSWTQLGSGIYGLQNAELSGNDTNSVALSYNGRIIAIGSSAYDSSISATDNVGVARVYEWDGTSWSIKGSSIVGKVGEDQKLGDCVSLSDSGLTLAVGILEGTFGVTNSGTAKVFTWDGFDWNQIGQTLSGDAANDQFGGSLQLSSDGKTLVVGAYFSDEFTLDQGKSQVYRYSQGQWEELGSPVDNRGYTVAISNDGNIISASRPYSQTIYMHYLSNGEWEEYDTFTGANNFGYSFGMDSKGQYMVVGERGFDSSKGRIKILQTRPSLPYNLITLDESSVFPMYGRIQVSNTPLSESYSSYSLAFRIKPYGLSDNVLGGSTHSTDIVSYLSNSGNGLTVKLVENGSTSEQKIVTELTDGTNTTTTENIITGEYTANTPWLNFILRYSPTDGLETILDGLSQTDTTIVNINSALDELVLFGNSGLPYQSHLLLSHFNFFSRYLEDAEVALLNQQLSG